MIGQTLSHYRITTAIGAGGMGEVYRATDTKLGRDVAIKILPSEVAKDPARLERFHREAHLLAALNHPHIAAIHGLEEADGQPFLVLELVEGEDLKQRLERGPIPVDEALEIAEQVAEALEEAHNKGIVHRDLKPANVKLAPDGKVKVLDFGLAKAWAGETAEGSPSSASMSQSPTLAHSGTQAGVILGTAAYMSPEQARGKAVDKRGDVWAFGVLLWEMLTGRALFAGDTVTDVIAAVVTKEPDLDALPAETPRAIRWLIARCLRKDPRTRLPDIGAGRLALQDVLAGTAPEAEALADQTGGTTPAERRRRVRERLWAACALVAAGVAATLGFFQWSEVPEPKHAVRFTVDAPEGWSFEWPIPSPDGRHIVAVGRPDNPGESLTGVYWLHSLESGTARPLRGTEGADWGSDPFWSPDGRFIGFFADGELRKIRLDNDTVLKVCVLPARHGFNADWNDDGTILFGAFDGPRSTEPGGFYTVPATGGEPKPLLMPDLARGERFLGVPRFLPDGRRFLFTALENADGQLGALGVHVASLDRPDERRLLVPGIISLGLAKGHVLFQREGTLLAQSFDVGRAQLHGEPVAIASSVRVNEVDWGEFGVSPAGTLAYFTGEIENRFQLAWLDRRGKQVGTVGEPGAYVQIALSPDETRVAVTIQDARGQRDLWLIDASRGVESRLTSDPVDEMRPVWSPDGREVAFSKGANDRYGLFRKGLYRGASAEPMLEPPGNDFPSDWSRDGETFLYVVVEPDPTPQPSLWAMSLTGDGTPEPVVQWTGHELGPGRLSPDGGWLAYVSKETGEWEVYIVPFQREGEKERVSVDGGGQPQWRADGKELFYRKLGGPLMAVEVREAAGRLKVSLPTELFDAGQAGPPQANFYAPSADGQRFLVKLPVESERKREMHVVLNWESLLE